MMLLRRTSLLFASITSADSVVLLVSRRDLDSSTNICFDLPQNQLASYQTVEKANAIEEIRESFELKERLKAQKSQHYRTAAG